MADGNRSDDFDAFLASLNTDTAKNRMILIWTVFWQS